MALHGRRSVLAAFRAGVMTGLLPATATAQPVALRFDRGAGGSVISPAFCGLSYEENQLTYPFFSPGNRPLTRLFGLLGRSVLRIGANAVDLTGWAGNVPGHITVVPARVDACAAFVRQVGWSVIWGLNLARSTPAVAADEAAYVARHLGDALLASEIGNKPDVYRLNAARRPT